MNFEKIVKYPNPLLRKKSVEVSIDNIDENVISDCIKTLVETNAAGISAVQLGYLQRICAIKDFESSNKNDYIVFVNPTIVEYSKKLAFIQEGCLSFPNYFDLIDRPKDVTVSWFDYTTKEHKTQEFTGFNSRCIQHEIDHLDGKLWIDYISYHYKKRVNKELLV